MNYKKYYDLIMNELKTHKDNIDGLVTTYKAEKAGLERRLADMKGKYTEEYIEETRKNWSLSQNYAQQMEQSKSKHGTAAEYYLSVIEKQLNKYFNAPIKREFADKITTIKLSGLQLSNRELDLLQQDATTYMERRLVNELAVTRTKKADTFSIENGRETIDKPNGYAYIELPDIDATYKAFQSFATQCRFMLKNYSGENVELLEYHGSDVPGYISVTADTILKNSQTRENFVNVMEKANSIIPKKKQSLTEQDKKLIDCIIDSKYPTLAKEKVIAIAENAPELADLLRLDERYSGYLETEE